MANPPRTTAESPANPHGHHEPHTPAVSGARVRLTRLFGTESVNYFLLLGTTLFLVVLGLIMVLSSSSVEQYAGGNGFFSGFWKQLTFAAVGVPLMLVVSRLPVGFLKKWAWLALIGSCALQMLVVFTPLGEEIGGNTNWLRIGGFQFQPSEIIKLALVLWLGLVLARKQPLLQSWKHSLIPVIPIGGGAIALVMAGGDLGTVLIMLMILFAALYYAGVRLRVLGALVLTAVPVIYVLTLASPSRIRRITMFFGDGCVDYENACWQPLHGTWALANGGILGAGLGNSKAKWSWLPEADNDYIYAIIGEELGLIGAVVVLMLFALLAFSFIRIIRSARDPFVRVVTGAVMVWLIGQAFVNIAVVLELAPVLGVPLPLISSGGTALVSTLVAIGIVLSFARVEQRPEKRAPMKTDGSHR